MMQLREGMKIKNPAIYLARPTPFSKVFTCGYFIVCDVTR